MLATPTQEHRAQGVDGIGPETHPGECSLVELLAYIEVGLHLDLTARVNGLGNSCASLAHDWGESQAALMAMKRVVECLQCCLAAHIRNEEVQLFPRLRIGVPFEADGRIQPMSVLARQMRARHAEAARLLRQLKGLAEHVELPPTELRMDGLMRHIEHLGRLLERTFHLEEEELLMRAMRLEAA